MIKILSVLSLLLICCINLLAIKKTTTIVVNGFNENIKVNLPPEIKDRKWTEIRSSKYNVSKEGGRLYIVLPPSKHAKTSIVESQFKDYNEWLSIAEKTDAILIFPDPGEDLVWDSSDLNFLEALYSHCDRYRLQGASRYIAAYGDAGIPASIFAVTNTEKIAGAAFIDAELANINEGNIKKKNLPLAVQIINTTSNNLSLLVEYFMAANETNSTNPINENELIYSRRGQSEWNFDYSKSHFIQQISNLNINTPTLIYNNLFNKVRRWRTKEGIGTLRPIAWAGEIEGFERITEQGIPEREAFVYIPSALTNDTITNAVPMVMLFHGVTCDGEYFMDQTDWYRVAEKNNFIVYAPSGPSAHWNVSEKETDADNYSFIINRINEIISSGLSVGDHVYRINSSQIYAYGFSNGSFFTSQLAMKYPEKFAAVMCWAGGSEPDKVKNNKNIPIPVWYGIGSKDVYYDDWKEWGKIMVNHFIKLAGADSTTKRTVYHNALGYEKLIKTDIYETGTVEIRNSEAKDIVHGNINDFPHIIWDEFFSKYKKQGAKSVLIDPVER